MTIDEKLGNKFDEKLVSCSKNNWMTMNKYILILVFGTFASYASKPEIEPWKQEYLNSFVGIYPRPDENRIKITANSLQLSVDDVHNWFWNHYEVRTNHFYEQILQKDFLPNQLNSIAARLKVDVGIASLLFNEYQAGRYCSILQAYELQDMNRATQQNQYKFDSTAADREMAGILYFVSENPFASQTRIAEMARDLGMKTEDLDFKVKLCHVWLFATVPNFIRAVPQPTKQDIEYFLAEPLGISYQQAKSWFLYYPKWQMKFEILKRENEKKLKRESKRELKGNLENNSLLQYWNDW